MKGIDPKWIMYLGLLVTVEQAIGHGTVSLTNLVPASWAPYITSWCNFLAFVGTTVMTCQAAVSSPAAGPLVNPPPQATAMKSGTTTVVKILLAAFLLSLFLSGPSALAQERRGRIPLPIDPLGLNKQPTTGDLGFDITKALDAKLLPDLQYALKLAQATNSQVTAPCYQAWIDMINTQTTAVETKNADGTTTDLAVPDPHVITDFERLVELRNALQPESKFMISCSPVASMIKTDILGFMAKVVGGGAALATLVPGL